jgi:prophage regulatory protein
MPKLIPFERLKPDKGVPYTRDHTRRLVKDGLFPKPVQLGPGRIAWLEDEVDAWIAARAAARNNSAA